MAARLTRRAALAALGVLGVGSVVGLRYFVRGPFEAPAFSPRIRLTDDDGMMGVGQAEMATYMTMFSRHTEITRTVEEIPGGVRTTTQSDSPDLAVQLRDHVSAMYSHLDGGSEIMCMSSTLPVLFRNAGGYRRQLTFTQTGVVAEETADDPALIDMIRAHAREVTDFVLQGMPAMMQGMMGPGMGPGMMGPHHP
jgi:hypothetical protein